VDLTGPHLTWVSAVRIPLVVVELEYPIYRLPASMFCVTLVTFGFDSKNCIMQINFCRFGSRTPPNRQNLGIKAHFRHQADMASDSSAGQADLCCGCPSLGDFDQFPIGRKMVSKSTQNE
jgi:hypothetical protein